VGHLPADKYEGKTMALKCGCFFIGALGRVERWRDYLIEHSLSVSGLAELSLLNNRHTKIRR
jgi:hypothetical protein